MDVQVLLVFLFAACWIALFPIAFYLDSKLCGWRHRAAQDPGLPKHPADALRLKDQWIRLENGGTDFRRVSAAIRRDGLQLVMPSIVLRLFYPDLFLPWKDLVSANRERGWLWERVRLTFANAPDDPITIYASQADKILTRAGPVRVDQVTHKPSPN